MKHHHIAAITAVLALSAVLGLTGCSSSGTASGSSSTQTAAAVTQAAEVSAASEAPVAPASMPAMPENKNPVGMILSIDTDSKQITISSVGGSFPGGGSFDKPSGSVGQNRPEIPTGTAPEMPTDGSFDPSKKPDGVPSDSKPSGQHGGEKDFGGTTYSVTDDTVIKSSDGTVITLGELSVNSFVEFTADGDNLLTLTVTENPTAESGT